MPEKKSKSEETKQVAKKAEKVEKTEKTEKVEKVEKTEKTEKSKQTKKTAKKENKKESKKEVTKKDGAKKGNKKAQKAKVAKKEKKAKTQEGGKKRDRSFKVIYVNPKGVVEMEGRYCGAKPKQAACKALTGIYKIFKEEDKPVDNEIKFGVYETTRGSKNKRYWYSGKKTELEEPIKLYQIPSTDGKKKYCSAERIESMGGFVKVLGEEQKSVKPSITYNFTNEVKKVSDDKCKHLQKVEKVVGDESETQSAGSNKKESKKAKSSKSEQSTETTDKQPSPKSEKQPKAQKVEKSETSEKPKTEQSVKSEKSDKTEKNAKNGKSKQK